MNELDTILDAAAAALGESTGMTVMKAYPAGAKHRFAAPAAALCVRTGTACAAGFGEYLGERFDETTGGTVETYGKRLDITLGADIYSPNDGTYGADGCIAAVSGVISASAALPAGIRVKKFTCGEVKFDTATGMFVCAVDIECSCMMYAERTGDEEISAFTLKGEITRR